LLPLPDVPRRADPDVPADDLHVAVGPAGMVDVAADVTAERGVARPAVVDGEDPDALPRQVALLAAPGLGLRHELSLVLDDERELGNRLRGAEPPSPGARSADGE